MVGTAELESVKMILSTLLDDFELGTRRRAGFAGLFGDGIFAVDGNKWSWYFARACSTSPQDAFANRDASLPPDNSLCTVFVHTA